MSDTVQATPTAPTRSGGGSRLDRVPPRVLSALVGIGVILLWELLARTVYAGSYRLSPPTAVVVEFFEFRGLYLRNLWHSTKTAAWGFLWGNLAAVALAAVASLVPLLRRSIGAIALTIFCLPFIAVAPILRLITGPGNGTPIALSALAVVFTTYVAALLGFDLAPGGALDVVRSYGRGRLVAFRDVRLRASVPAMFAGLQIAAPAAFLGAVVGEFTGAHRGLGILTVRALGALQTDRIWVIAVLSTIVATGGYLAIGALGRYLCPWSPALDLGAVPTPRQGPGLLNRLVALLAPILVVFVFWYAFLWVFQIKPFFAKTPFDVWAELFTNADAPETRSMVFGALWTTLWTTALGYVAGLIGALVTAVVFILVPWLERALMPIAVALRSIPIIVTTPVIILFVGRGLLTTTAIVAVMSFFPTLVNCYTSMARTPEGVLDVLRSYDAGSTANMRNAYLPTAVPALLASARIAVPTSLLGATVAEWLATGDGIGAVMVTAFTRNDYNVLWVSVAVLTLVAVIGYWLVAAFELRTLERMAPGISR
ncbi:MAG: ABC transporter permease subunit [Acidimicrobiaceae bacterium]|nr:ABC transporter permease subunit [Acidimicrobiaceae bacterium]